MEITNPDFEYMTYKEGADKLEKFPIPLGQKVYSIKSVGGWLYVLTFNISEGGKNLEGPLKIISKDTMEQVFEDTCFIGPDV